MRTILFCFYFSISFLGTIIFGQGSPVKVDNSEFFPPAGIQSGPSCTHFSLINYLKSYIWNKQFLRNPTLPENQFSYQFLWNQNVSNTDHYSTTGVAAGFMSLLGCATLADFPLQPDVEHLPNLATKEKGLPFRSKNINQIWLFATDSLGTIEVLNQLKDSLAQGVCFTIGVPVFPYMINLNEENPIYYCTPGISRDSMISSHAVTVVGYDDTLTTWNGSKGAFKVINSNGINWGDDGYFYFDYNWFFYAKWWGWTFTFLQEDFDYQPELTLNLDISGMVSGESMDLREYIFVDSVFTSQDYRSDAYGLIRLVNLNRTPLFKYIFLPRHNHDGNRNVILDLTDYITASDFRSMELIINDPISATYLGENDNIIYSYVRDANAGVNEAYIKLLETNQILIGEVTDLPDTLIVAYNFYSSAAAFHLIPPSTNPLFIKQCVTNLRRKKISFASPNGSLPPISPSNLIATPIAQTKIDLSWLDNSDNEDGFKIERKSSSSGSFSEIATVGPEIIVYQDTSVIVNTNYCYRIRAYNLGSNSMYSNEACARPNAPTNLTAVPLGPTTIQLSWEDIPENDYGAFIIEWKLGSNGTWSELTLVEAGVTTYQNEGLTENTNYCYRVKALTNSGDISNYSNEACATTFQTHFIPSWSGNPYNPMNIDITGVSLSGGGTLSFGDEIGVYDGINCVGSVFLTESIPSGGFVSITASTDDPNTTAVDGFIPGHAISYKFWLSSIATEISDYTANYSVGDGAFASQGTAVLSFTNVLPVELTSFTANLNKTQVDLKWQTATEVNNYGFDVERKTESSWEKIGFVEGNGNSSSPKEYSFTDNKLVGGTKFQYRLKQIDSDGKYEYSAVVEVENIPTEYALYQNYPNPFNPTTKIRYQLPKESKVVIKIYNILGSEVLELLNENKEPGIYEVEFNSDNLSSGTYIYKISADNFVQTKKMILLK